MSLQISQLAYYPIKSLGQVVVPEMKVTEWGPHHDRRLMLVDENGKFLTQRQLPQMALFEVMDNGLSLSLRYQNQSMSIQWPSLDQAELTGALTVNVWSDEVQAIEVSEAASAWLSKLLGRTAKLVAIPDVVHRQVDLEYAEAGDRVGFSDGFPFLLISEASIRAMESELDFDLQMKRFRPNIVVSGCEAFAEDAWKQISINNVVFDVVKPCSRCVIPTLNPETAERQPEVMRVLVKHRKQGNAVYMGQNLIHRGEGELSVGDEVKIIT